MVTKIGTAKQTLQQDGKADAWLTKCGKSAIATPECEEAVAAIAAADAAIAAWIEEQN